MMRCPRLLALESQVGSRIEDSSQMWRKQNRLVGCMGSTEGTALLSLEVHVNVLGLTAAAVFLVSTEKVL